MIVQIQFTSNVVIKKMYVDHGDFQCLAIQLYLHYHSFTVYTELARENCIEMDSISFVSTQNTHALYVYSVIYLTKTACW